MSENPYKQNKDYEQQPNRNSFDLSFTNNLTMNFGGLYPVMCKPVIPGDYFKIRAAFALRFMPLLFPVQTRCRAHIHFFYQRNKNLWKNWQDFFAANKPHFDPTKGGTAPIGSVTHPYLVNRSSNHTIGTGLLGDYLNLPTTIVGSYSGYSKLSSQATTFDKNKTQLFGYYENSTSSSPFYGFRFGMIPNLASLKATMQRPENNPYRISAHINQFPQTTHYYSGFTFIFNGDPREGFSFLMEPLELVELGTTFDLDSNQPAYVVLLDSNGNYKDAVKADISYYDNGFEIQAPRITATFKSFIAKNDRLIAVLPVSNYLYDPYPTTAPDWSASVVNSLAAEDINGKTEYFGSDNPVNALPFRCYESIYNSFYRDNRNNPFMINGVEEFNKYVTNDGDGLDNTDYHIFNRNWELDQFTSAVPSPQQGMAPLVGFSTNGDLVSYSADGDETLIAKLDGDGDLQSAEVKSALKSLSVSLSSLASSGISINDFRNVNAYQRWKETNLRRGLKYKDQIKARWGVDLKESLLDMPEFIGGISCDVDVNQVSSTVQNEMGPLGSYAGQMTAFSKTDNAVSQYCDDYGYIMAIISVVPTPVYTQSCPKDFFKFSPLDYYSPEFGQIGMQPVPYKELVTIQSMEPISDIEPGETFGYQRPWYDYLNSTDEAHGLFRTNLQNFLLNRVFSMKPRLGSSFTTINHSELSNIFATDSGDKILGQIYFDIEAKRPIPKISVPSIS